MAGRDAARKARRPHEESATERDRGIQAAGLAVVLLACAALSACAPRSGVRSWQVDSLVKVFPDDEPGTNSTSEEVLVPRNGHANIQFALRTDARYPDVRLALRVPRMGASVLVAQARRAGYVPVGSNTPDTPEEERSRAAPALFPDPLLETVPFALEAGRTESIWVSVYAPAASAAGEYAGDVSLLAGGSRLATLEFKVRVAPAAVPRQTLQVTNWLDLSPEHLGRYYRLDGGPDRYWELLGNIGRVMANHGQNVLITPILSLVDVTAAGNGFNYDFARFDRWVGTFEKAGLLGTIEGAHLLGRSGGYFSPVTVDAYTAAGGRAVRQDLDPDDPRAEAFLNSFLPALYSHLDARGWTSRYIQHILDEPHGREAQVYSRYAGIVRRHLPGIPTVDAVSLHEKTDFLTGSCDTWVPVLGSFDHQMDLLREHSAGNGRTWFYTCLTPRGRYLNRFIDYPLLKVRLLHWFNFRHGLAGFLHWGGNYWGPEPFRSVQPVINGNRTLLPPGDNAIVYPYPEKNTVLSSIRLEAMAEGIEDHELLTALAAKDRAMAERIASTAIPNVNDYVRDVAEFRKLRRKLLEALQ